MNKAEEKRLQRFKEDSEKEVGGLSLYNLSYPDLLLLLNEDKKLRKLIRNICGSDEPEVVNDDVSATVTDHALNTILKTGSQDPELSSPISAPHVESTLRNELASELALLSRISADPELAAEWLTDSDTTEGRQLARLIARASQWDSVLGLWDCLAARCKAEKRPVSHNEQLILADCLKIHNLLWFSRQAELSHIVPGETFDFKRHERALHQGETVLEEWLPGLTNAGGQTQRRPLVKT